MSNIVAIVGRPNVGKSTLFNRLVGKRKAIVDDMSGVTRDRIYDFAEWTGTDFILVDTGGYVTNSDDIFESEIRKQVEFAIEEADVIVFMVDMMVGITDQDESFGRYLRRVKKPILLVANKTDDFSKINQTYEFYKLGFKEVFPVSSVTGSGTGELLDRIVENLKELGNQPIDSTESDLPKIAIIGKPNVGKSTFINTLLGEERNIVSDIPGTTRDSIHTVYNKFDRKFIIIDTAGLRKKNKVYEDIEFYSNLRAIRTIEESDICLVLLDARDGLQAQDLHIIDMAAQRNKGVVILLNKWDLVQQEAKTSELIKKKLTEKLAPFNDIPIITMSALNKVRIFQSIDKAFEVFENKHKLIPTSALNKVMLKVIEEYHPPANRGKFIQIKYVTQMKAAVPLFAFFCNHPKDIKESYKRYLENKIRDNFNFEGVPIRIIFKEK
jgi:GTP-binding protein